MIKPIVFYISNYYIMSLLSTKYFSRKQNKFLYYNGNNKIKVNDTLIKNIFNQLNPYLYNKYCNDLKFVLDCFKNKTINTGIYITNNLPLVKLSNEDLSLYITDLLQTMSKYTAPKVYHKNFIVTGYDIKNSKNFN